MFMYSILVRNEHAADPIDDLLVAVRRVSASVARRVAEVSERREARRRAAAVTAGLDDRLLKDIGITREAMERLHHR
jgi:uncharacterized protein YjiS (DUF1127 family)